jgi:hypothetical protein
MILTWHSCGGIDSSAESLVVVAKMPNKANVKYKSDMLQQSQVSTIQP